MLQVMRHDNHRLTVVAQGLDERQDLAHLLHAQRRGGLVENEKLPASPVDGPPDGDRLALPTGEIRHGPLRIGNVDAQPIQRGGGLGVHPARVGDREPPELQQQGFVAEKHVRRHVERVGEGQVLVEDLDAERAGVLRRADRHFPSTQSDRAAVRRLHTGDGLDQRGLAGSVVADERNRLALHNGQ